MRSWFIRSSRKQTQWFYSNKHDGSTVCIIRYRAFSQMALDANQYKMTNLLNKVFVDVYLHVYTHNIYKSHLDFVFT